MQGKFELDGEKQRIVGATKKATGKVKETVGRMLGERRTEAEGNGLPIILVLYPYNVI